MVDSLRRVDGGADDTRYVTSGYRGADLASVPDGTPCPYPNYTLMDRSHTAAIGARIAPCSLLHHARKRGSAVSITPGFLPLVGTMASFPKYSKGDENVIRWLASHYTERGTYVRIALSRLNILDSAFLSDAISLGRMKWKSCQFFSMIFHRSMNVV